MQKSGMISVGAEIYTTEYKYDAEFSTTLTVTIFFCHKVTMMPKIDSRKVVDSIKLL